MEHADAIETHAAERYLLGEMSEDERSSFEEHYFDCRLCTADVTDGTRLMMAGRTVVVEDARPSNVVPMRVDRFQWMPAAAAAALIFGLVGGGIGYRIAPAPQPAPQPAPSELIRTVQIDTGALRSGTSGETPAALHRGDVLRFDIPPDNAAETYAAVLTCGGKVQSRHDISRELAADAISLRIGELPSGRCELVIDGVRKDGNRFEIARSPFQVAER